MSSSVDRIVTDPQTFKRVSRELRKLSFTNPGPQNRIAGMKSKSAAVPQESTESLLPSRRRSKPPSHYHDDDAPYQSHESRKRHNPLPRRAKDKKTKVAYMESSQSSDSEDTDCQIVVDEENEDNEEIAKCDCLQANCPGCFFPCKKCGSQYCGVTCKKLRGWNYTSVAREESA